jgi:hypothetical protein
MSIESDKTMPEKESAEKKKKDSQLTSIKGIVLPVNWDEKGNIVALALSTHEEDEYLIEVDEKGQELMAFVRDEVVVTGIVNKTEKGKTIAVKKYRLKPGHKRNR